MKPAARSSSIDAPYHAVRFYESVRSLAQIVAGFLAEGFAEGSPGIIVASPVLRAAIIRELTARSFDVVELQRSKDLLLLDATETLLTFMTEGRPDSLRFNAQMCQAIESVCVGRSTRRVRIFGQMVDVLWQEGKRDAATRLEVLWNQLANERDFSLLCGYAMGNFYKDSNFEDICSQHSHVVSNDGRAIAAE